MNEYRYNKKYLTKNGEPWFPVMGEFHYSRYPVQYWKESLYKMKAGGVEIVSTYVFWLHHEEIEGEYDFTGQRNLRKFVETVKECGLVLFLRIGPWCHGEVRNGGFPDWLLQKNFEPRTNDPCYFDEVRRFYAEISRQVSGLLHKDGGPVIGIQIENEYGHCGGLGGEEGERHMRTLTALAKEVGLTVPLYTATGWGGAVTAGLLPVMGGYCEAPWDQRTTKLEPNENYVFTNDRNDPNIGSDYGKTHNLTYDITAFPYLTAELGGGLQVTHHRRPVASGKDIGAMSLTKLGSGVNLLGYYMYHGGTNPRGKRTTLQESRATGYLNDLPVFSYDFSAPIREYGQMSETLKELKLLTLFVKDFGSELCKMDGVWAAGKTQEPEDLQTLRTAVRRNGKSGYLFVNNYQRSYAMRPHLQERLKVQSLTYPPVDIFDGDFFFLPFYMPVGNGELRQALTTPLCRIRDEKEWVYVFYTGANVSGDESDCEDRGPRDKKCGETENDVDSGLYAWERRPTDARILTISREMALNLWRIGTENQYLLISEDGVIENGDGYTLLLRRDEEIQSCPELPAVPEGFEAAGRKGEFYCYRRTGALPTGKATWNEVPEVKAAVTADASKRARKRYEISLSYPEGCTDCFLEVDFSGDQANLIIDGEIAGDWFYTGKTWEIGMKRFGFPKKVEIEITPLLESDDIFLETKPEFCDGAACRLSSVSLEGEFEIRLGKICPGK